MDILSKNTVALLSDPKLRAKIEEILRGVNSSGTVIVTDESGDGDAADSSVSHGSSREIVVRRLVA